MSTHAVSAGNTGQLSQETTRTGTHTKRFNICGAETLLLSDMSGITPCVDNKLCNPPPSLFPLCLQSLSVCIVLKLTREEL